MEKLNFVYAVLTILAAATLVSLAVASRVMERSEKKYSRDTLVRMQFGMLAAAIIAVIAGILWVLEVRGVNQQIPEIESAEELILEQPIEEEDIEALQDFGPGGLDSLTLVSVFGDPESPRYVENKLDLASTPIFNEARADITEISDAVGFPLYFDESILTSRTSLETIRKEVEIAKEAYEELGDDEKIDLLNEELLNRRFQNPAQLIQEIQGLLKYEPVLVNNKYWLRDALETLEAYYSDDLTADEYKGYERLVEYDNSGVASIDHLQLTDEYREWAGRVTFLIDALVDQGIYDSPQSSWNYHLEPATSMREIWPEEADYQENKPAILKAYVQKNGKQVILVGWNLLDGRFEGFEKTPKKPVVTPTPEPTKPTPTPTPKTPKPTPTPDPKDPDPTPDPDPIPPTPTPEPKKDPSKDPANQGNANQGGGNTNADGTSDENRPAPDWTDYTPPADKPENDPIHDDGGGAHDGTHDTVVDQNGGVTHDNDYGNTTRNGQDQVQETTAGGGTINISDETVDGTVEIPD